MPDRLVVDLTGDGQAAVLMWPDGGFPEEVSRAPLTWPLDSDALEDLRWYLEDYLLAPYGVWEEHGPAIQDKLPTWGDQVFASVFGPGPARDAYQRARDRGLELVFRSAEPALLALLWELMRDSAGPVALATGGISRSLPVATGAGTLEVPGGHLRVLMVISRPAGTRDVGYQMVARPLLERLDAVRGEVNLTVLRPPTFDALREAVTQAAAAGEPFHVVHFDGHGVMPDRALDVEGRPAMMIGKSEGVLAFERPADGDDLISASKIAAVLADGKVPVAILNACQSGAVGKDLEASVATALLKAGCAAVVAMAYSVYAVAAAEFMAAFYESLFVGTSVAQAVTVGRRRLSGHDGRPSPRGDMPLADWLVPVHYQRREVRFPQARATRPAEAPSLDEALDEVRAAPPEPIAAQDPLAAVRGVFVGRDDLFYRLETAARMQRVVVLSGPGGTGKTELAKGFARWWRDTGGVDDPRLVLWHSFEPGVATFGLDGVITGIGLTVLGADFARLDQPQRLGAVQQLLAQYRALLVWDNFESVREMPDPTGATPPLDEAGCAALKAFLGWIRDQSRSAVIITSRAPEDWLGQLGRIIVGGLNRVEAAQYADHLLAPFPAARQRRNRRSFGELMDWLDGHPLAMRLTLPRLETTGPANLLAALQGTIPPPVPDAADANRTTSLAASITYSYAHLSDQTRQLLPAVSLFHGVADANLLTLFSAAEGVPPRFADIGRPEWTAVLEHAARVGLLTSLGVGMYQIHPALPGYLAAVWQAGGLSGYSGEREACEQALCTACAVFSELLTRQFGSGNAVLAYVITGFQRRTLGAALGYALDHGAWAEAQRIVQALDAYWDIRGLGGEADAWADRILAVAAGPGQAQPGDARELWLYITVQQATRQKGAGHPEQAGQTYQRALAYLQEQPDSDETRRNIAVLYHQLGMTAEDRGRLDEAEDWYRRSLAIKEDLGDRHGMAGTYNQLGATSLARGRLDEAEDWYRNALTIFQDHGDRRRMAVVYGELGNTAYLRERMDGAEDWYRRSLAIKEDLGDRPGMALCYGQLGMTALVRWRLDEAEDWNRRCLTIFEDLGDRPHMAQAYGQLGATAQSRGRLDEAEDWYRRSLAINEDLGDRPGMALCYGQLGATAQSRGRLDEAEDWYRRSLAINEDLGNRSGVALKYGQLGLLAEARQQPGQALDWTVRCVTLFDRFPHPLTGPGPHHLARLTNLLGMPALQAAWQQVTGRPLPQAVRDYITSQRHEAQPEGTP